MYEAQPVLSVLSSWSQYVIMVQGLRYLCCVFMKML